MIFRFSIRQTPARIPLILTLSRRCLSAPSATLPRAIGTGTYAEGDRVLVKYQDGRKLKSRLLSPLKAEGSSRMGKNQFTLKHADIIGHPSKRFHAEAVDQKGQKINLRISPPTLEQFVSLAPRTVTPIYASYSAFIANLLDIHVEPPTEENNPTCPDVAPLQILEAGTGHGSLTMHLARSIAAANPPPPSFKDTSDPETVTQLWKQWKLSRRAILHTVEYNASRSQDAENIIRSFRGGLYWPHIDFHSGDVGKWVQNRVEQHTQDNTFPQFLDVICLDMPAPHTQIEHVQQVMKNYGQLLIYAPQITQLVACQQEIDRLQLPLKLDQVVELGEGISNGRVWDLRFVTTKAEHKRLQQEQLDTPLETDNQLEPDETTQTPVLTSNPPEETSSDSEAAIQDIDTAATSIDSTVLPSENTGTGFPTMVCRPMVGRLIMGGAFIGLWRKVAKS